MPPTPLERVTNKGNLDFCYLVLSLGVLVVTHSKSNVSLLGTHVLLCNKDVYLMCK